MPTADNPPIRVGAVNYLNSKPLIHRLRAKASNYARDCGVHAAAICRAVWPIRSPTGRLDVALIPAFEFFLDPGYRVVSNACVASDGPVGSVKVYFRSRAEPSANAGSRRGLADQRRAVTRCCCVSGASVDARDRAFADRFRIGRHRGRRRADRRSAMPQPCGPSRARGSPTLGTSASEWRKDTRSAVRFRLLGGSSRKSKPARSRTCCVAAATTGVRNLKEIADRRGPAARAYALTTRSVTFVRTSDFTLGDRARQALAAFRQACASCELLPSSVRAS